MASKTGVVLTNATDYCTLSGGLNTDAAVAATSPLSGCNQVLFIVSGTFTGASASLWLKTLGGTWIKIAVSDIGAAAPISAGTITLSDSVNKMFGVKFSPGSFIDAKIVLEGISTGTPAIEIDSGRYDGQSWFSMPITVASTPQTITSANAAALAVGANGATNPVLKVDASTSSVVSGLGIAGAAAGGNTVITVLGTGGEGATFTGKAGNGAQAGGVLTFTGGAGGGTSGAGGAVSFTGGAGTAGNAAGGAASLIGGLGQGSAAGGAITITSGAAGATGVAGAVNISVGAATAGAGSALTLTAGNGAGGTAAGGSVNLVGGTAVSTGVPGEVQVNAKSDLIYVQVALSATDASRAVHICTRPMRLKSVSYMHTTGSTSGTLQIEKLTGTTAAGSGTTLLTGTIDLSATTVANTTTNGTLIATVASITFATGDRLGVKIGGTMTSLAGAIVSIGLAPA